MATNQSNHNTGMRLLKAYVVLFFVNSIVILAANALFPQHVVLGTANINTAWAIIHSVGALTLINTFAMPFIAEYERKRGQAFTDREWMTSYLVINFVSVWVITRFADNMGFGITSFIVAAALAIALDIAQGIAMMQLEKSR